MFTVIGVLSLIMLVRCCICSCYTLMITDLHICTFVLSIAENSITFRFRNINHTVISSVCLCVHQFHHICMNKGAAEICIGGNRCFSSLYVGLCSKSRNVHNNMDLEA